MDNNEFESTRGVGYFSKRVDTFRRYAEIADGIFADINLSATSICKRIQKILNYYAIPHSEMKIYLSKDRNA